MTEAAVQAIILVAVVAGGTLAVTLVSRRGPARRRAVVRRNELLRAGDPENADSTRNGPVSFLAPGGNGGRG